MRSATLPASLNPGGEGPPRPIGFIARRRAVISVLLHAFLFALGLLISFGVANNFYRALPFRILDLSQAEDPGGGGWLLYQYLPMALLAVPLKLIVFAIFHQYRQTWRYVGLRDLLGVAGASYVGSFVLMVAYFAAKTYGGGTGGAFASFLESAFRADIVALIDQSGVGFREGSVFLADLVATIGLVSVARVFWRLYHEEVKALPAGQRRRILILGAGRSGETVLREIIGAGERQEVVGFLDDDPDRWHNRIHGVEVLGGTADVLRIAKEFGVEEILIAIPGAPPKEIRRIVESCQGASITFRTIPSVSDLIEGRVEVRQIRSVSIEDLLGRDPVELDTTAIGNVLKNRRIAITGAGGSIGSEMCRQIALFHPQRLILIEQAENNLFEIDRELRAAYPELDIVPCVADICDGARIRRIFALEKPSAVFHAAAHKHVPMMESNPGEAVKNNVVGTQIVADAAVEARVEKVVMISTDKAVNPTSIMGCTKRVAELYVQQLSARSRTQFVTVRFGNVLGSSGSVVPIFRRQIAAGGPVTVTHPEMKRYFMTIPEAAQLVLQAGAMGNGGEIYVLDMGDPVKIVDLARDMIVLSGLRPGSDIEITFTGMRPGEKLFEELSIEGEDISATSHPKIGIWRHRPENWERLCAGVEQLIAAADTGSREEVVAPLRCLVPEFQPENVALPCETPTAVAPAGTA